MTVPERRKTSARKEGEAGVQPGGGEGSYHPEVEHSNTARAHPGWYKLGEAAGKQQARRKLWIAKTRAEGGGKVGKESASGGWDGVKAGSAGGVGKVHGGTRGRTKSVQSPQV